MIPTLTLDESLVAATLRPRSPAEGLALVIVWSRDEPARLGEVVLLPTQRPGTDYRLGRAGGDGTKGVVHLSLHRQRPGELLPTGPLDSPRISRDQFHLRVQSEHSILVQNLGRRPMEHSRPGDETGRVVDEATVSPGDTIGIQRSLLFLCVRRASRMVAGQEFDSSHPFGFADGDGLVGESPLTWQLREDLAFIAPRAAHVLVQGPSGVGKELVARALHAHSERRSKPLISRNCATIPESLIEAELFGNVRNYPNPGTPERVGLIGASDGSTLFLDEFGELSEAMQARLLRVMDEGEYHRLGDALTRRVDLRMVAATNRPDSALKHDVLARLKLRITIPGLDARREDIPLLTRHILRRIARQDNDIARRFFSEGNPEREPQVSMSLIRHLITRPYQTHIRELEAILWQAMRQSPGPELEGVKSPLESPVQAVPLEVKAAQASPARVLETRDDDPGQHLAGAGFDAGTIQLLHLQRSHGFSPTACAADPLYPGQRTAADRHLRIWMARALVACQGNREQAVALLTGPGHEELRILLLRRLDTFTHNLKSTLEKNGKIELEAYLERQYRTDAPALLEVVEAIIREEVRGGNKGGR